MLRQEALGGREAGRGWLRAGDGCGGLGVPSWEANGSALCGGLAKQGNLSSEPRGHKGNNSISQNHCLPLGRTQGSSYIQHRAQLSILEPKYGVYIKFAFSNNMSAHSQQTGLRGLENAAATRDLGLFREKSHNAGGTVQCNILFPLDK